MACLLRCYLGVGDLNVGARIVRIVGGLSMTVLCGVGALSIGKTWPVYRGRWPVDRKGAACL